MKRVHEPSARTHCSLPAAFAAAVAFVFVAARAGVPSEPASIVVAPGAGGIMVASDDAQALEDFAQLLTALAGGASGTKEETTVFYLKHAKAETVAELVEAIFSGGSLAASSGADDRALAPFGPFGQGPGGFFPGGAPGGGPPGPFGPRGPGQGGFPFGGAGDDRSARGGPGAAFPGASRRSPASNGSQRAGTQRSAGVRITPDARLNALIVRAGPDDTDIIEELLRILDQKPGAEVVPVESKPRLIPLRNIPVQTVADLLRQVYQDRLTNGGGGSAAPMRPDGPPQGPSPQGPGGPQEFFQQMAQMRGAAGPRGSGRRSGGDDVPKMAIGADVRTNSLVVVAPESLFAEVKALVDQLDRATGQGEETMQVVALRGANSDVLRQALTAFMGQRVRVGEAGPSAGARPNGAGVASARRSGSGRSPAAGGLPTGLGRGESGMTDSAAAPAASQAFRAAPGGSQGFGGAPSPVGGPGMEGGAAGPFEAPPGPEGFPGLAPEGNGFPGGSSPAEMRGASPFPQPSGREFRDGPSPETGSPPRPFGVR